MLVWANHPFILGQGPNIPKHTKCTLPFYCCKQYCSSNVYPFPFSLSLLQLQHSQTSWTKFHLATFYFQTKLFPVTNNFRVNLSGKHQLVYLKLSLNLTSNAGERYKYLSVQCTKIFLEDHWYSVSNNKKIMNKRSILHSRGALSTCQRYACDRDSLYPALIRHRQLFVPSGHCHIMML